MAFIRTKQPPFCTQPTPEQTGARKEAGQEDRRRVLQIQMNSRREEVLNSLYVVLSIAGLQVNSV